MAADIQVLAAIKTMIKKNKKGKYVDTPEKAQALWRHLNDALDPTCLEVAEALMISAVITALEQLLPLAEMDQEFLLGDKNVIPIKST